MIDPRQAVEAVRDDITGVLEGVLPSDDTVERAGFSVAEPFAWVSDTPIANSDSTVAVVPWEWRGVNRGVMIDERLVGLFGLDPTFAQVTIRGTTIVTEEEADDVDEAAAEEEKEPGLLFRRYIDWLDVLSQAGIAVYTRPIVDVRHAFDRGELDEIPELAEALRELEEREAESGNA